MAQGFDCASKLNATTAAALKGNGFDYVGRYLSHSSWKGLTADEANAIIGAGLQIFSIYETAPTQVGYFTSAQGVSDAQTAVQYAKEVGQPEGTAIYFTVDYAAQPGDMGAVITYLDAVRSTITGYKVGIYGSYNVMQATKGHADFFFQTYAWSGGQVADFLHIYQYKNGQTVAGVQLDKDEIRQAAGTWGSAAPVKVPAQVAPTPAPADAAPIVVPDTYVIQPGDTLSGIAAHFGVSQSTLQELNGISNPNLIKAGDTLRLKGSAPSPAPTPSGATYTVKPGDTLSGIAAAHGTTVSELQRLNGISNPNIIYEGQVLHLPSGAPQPAAPSMPATYIIQPGDTLSKIAARFGVSQSTLQKLNGISDPNKIYAGKKLRLR